jgi:hypothetical protein
MKSDEVNDENIKIQILCHNQEFYKLRLYDPVSVNAIRLLQGMLLKNVNIRLSLNEILLHPYFTAEDDDCLISIEELKRTSWAQYID